MSGRRYDPSQLKAPHLHRRLYGTGLWAGRKTNEITQLSKPLEREGTPANELKGIGHGGGGSCDYAGGHGSKESA